MVTTNSATSAASKSPTVASADASTKAIADFDTFLKLLTTQLANQDPLNPTDGTEFTAQLAQFSSLEQQINTNKLLEKMMNNQPDTKQAEAMSYIGKEVLVPGSNFKLNNSGNVEFSYEATSDVESAMARVYNSAGEKVHEFKVDTSQGLHDVVWDGRNSEGERLDSGVYKVKVEGSVTKNGSSTTQELTSYLYSEATKATKLGSDYAIMTADGRTAKLDEVLASRKLTSPSAGTDHANALQMLGKEILIPGNKFTYAGQPKTFTYGLTQDVKSVIVTITDKDGNKVKEVPFESTAGSHEYTWDGKNSSGDTVEPGEYNIKIKAQNPDSEGVIQEEGLDSLYYGKATKVESSGDSVLLYTDDGRKAFYDQVLTVKE